MRDLRVKVDACNLSNCTHNWSRGYRFIEMEEFCSHLNAKLLLQSYQDGETDECEESEKENSYFGNDLKGDLSHSKYSIPPFEVESESEPQSEDCHQYTVEHTLESVVERVSCKVTSKLSVKVDSYGESVLEYQREASVTQESVTSREYVKEYSVAQDYESEEENNYPFQGQEEIVYPTDSQSEQEYQTYQYVQHEDYYPSSDDYCCQYPNLGMTPEELDDYRPNIFNGYNSYSQYTNFHEYNDYVSD